MLCLIPSVDLRITTNRTRDPVLIIIMIHAAFHHVACILRPLKKKFLGTKIFFGSDLRTIMLLGFV